MSPKKPKNSSKGEIISYKGYIPLFSPDFKADLAYWYRHDSKKGDKILDLVADILDGEPFTGIGKPEALKYISADIWSRRIDLEHRLVYKVTENRIYFLQARYHYKS
ncbi:Txe/YoeB family addiction module toxin [Geminocystis sp. GBBB08]|uniref:Txe/YoeB family addiction module toxin n=1 Tax=Geminocystis sp. GBBB08 TaxID=2604140 RepID=UPI0027E3A7C2|nr:Txe/YoeB family addiction module toxin [Geminocystis sp. GBBB08]MBL1209584.1 Txe/YoeB family addiction module toxin [Geminocystis sp. GBBB08]